MQSKTTNSPLIDKPSTNHSLWIIVIAILSLFLASITGVQAQTIKQDAKGNFYALKSESDSAKAKPTGQTYTDTKGNSYPVLISKNGKLFCMVTSKNGNVYRKYLTASN